MGNNKTVYPVLSAVFTALLSAVSQIVIPTPFGVPLTLQTFAVALLGYLLGAFWGTVSVVLWILVGFIGLPVFSGFGSLASLFGPTGGFIWGFLVLAAACGAVKHKKILLRLTVAFTGLLVCHTVGILQFSAVYGVSVSAAFITVSLPYLLKDILSLLAADALFKKVQKRINKR